eukprot:TRINITY_DN14888_c0_g1_i1.p1 TRINITY_DN14888_c0_g1~~TRINITY_DN14888_c0_g1_i1.p1  ORF type:complete len:197 (+),score=27.21 TRINITY_DN14888_c0_g1_i1:88-678(+)
MVSNVLTPAECKKWIDRSEEKGYDDATHPKYQSAKIDMLERRNRENVRLVWLVEQEETEGIYQRLLSHLPSTVHNDRWRLCEGNAAINNMFRFYRYNNDTRFRAHYDNSFSKKGKRSHMSLLLYLNDDFEGGETTFYKWNRETEILDDVPVKPRQGSALIFFHSGKQSPLHEGSPHTAKNKKKYVIRSDIMFERNN